MQESEATKRPNSFVPLWREIRTRFCAPIGQVSFWVALIVGVVALGALGVWVELGKHLSSGHQNLENLKTAIHTFFPALAFTATMQLILSESEKKYWQSAGYALGVFLLFAAGFLLADVWLLPLTSIIVGAATSLFSVLIWWIANGLEPMFDDKVKPDAQVGGSTDVTLPGDVSGVKH